MLLVTFFCAFLCWPIQTALADLLPQAPLPAPLQQARFIAYTPRGFSVTNGIPIPATRDSIATDLALLRPHFDGLITYASTNGLERIPEVAASLGYRAVILGIWDPGATDEIDHAIRAATKFPNLVAAILVGNEGIYAKRYGQEEVRQAMARIRREVPGVPLATSEPFFLYLNEGHVKFFASHDLLMPIIHPMFEKWFHPDRPEEGVTMTLGVLDHLRRLYRNPILVKETGQPSGLSLNGFAPTTQARFWTELRKRFPSSPSLAFACFEAFDAPWKPAEQSAAQQTITADFRGDHGNEAHWGFFTADGQAKPVVDTLPPLPGRPGQ